MLEATLWGLLGASSLLLGALLATIGPVHRWLVARNEWRLGLLMAFGEAISSTPGLVARFGTRTTLAMWAVVVVASGLAAGIGYAALGDAPPPLVAAIQAYAAGAILVMLADEMIPGAHHRGHTAAGLATAIGFAVAAALSFTT
jgi:hypothetical protein